MLTFLQLAKQTLQGVYSDAFPPQKKHQVGLTKLAHMSFTTAVDQNDMCQPDCGTMFINACTARYNKSETKNNLLGTLQLTQMFHGTRILTNIYHEFKPFM